MLVLLITRSLAVLKACTVKHFENNFITRSRVKLVTWNSIRDRAMACRLVPCTVTAEFRVQNQANPV